MGAERRTEWKTSAERAQTVRQNERVKDKAREWQSDRLRGRESDRVKVKELRV